MSFFDKTILSYGAIINLKVHIYEICNLIICSSF